MWRSAEPAHLPNAPSRRLRSLLAPGAAPAGHGTRQHREAAPAQCPPAPQPRPAMPAPCRLPPPPAAAGPARAGGAMTGAGPGPVSAAGGAVPHLTPRCVPPARGVPPRPARRGCGRGGSCIERCFGTEVSSLLPPQRGRSPPRLIHSQHCALPFFHPLEFPSLLHQAPAGVGRSLSAAAGLAKAR